VTIPKDATYHARGVDALRNGSYVRVWGKKRDRFSTYMNGDYISTGIGKPPITGLDTFDKATAKKHLPKCCA
jgi:hypothetical protein